MKIKVVVHEAEEGGFWAEVPGHSAAPARAKRWTSFSPISTRPSRALLSVDVAEPKSGEGRVLEIAV